MKSTGGAWAEGPAASNCESLPAVCKDRLLQEQTVASAARGGHVGCCRQQEASSAKCTSLVATLNMEPGREVTQSPSSCRDLCFLVFIISLQEEWILKANISAVSWRFRSEKSCRLCWPLTSSSDQNNRFKVQEERGGAAPNAVVHLWAAWHGAQHWQPEVLVRAAAWIQNLFDQWMISNICC